MTSKNTIASQSQDGNQCHVQKMFGDKLNIEDKLQVLEALMFTCEQKTNLDRNQPPHSDLCDQECHYDCGVCGKKYKSSSQYYGHLKKHKKDNFQWACSQCPEGTSIFQSLSLLSKHKKSNHEEAGIYKCLKDKSVHTSVRDIHQNHIHSSHVQFACQLCDKNFNKKSDLRVHLATHLSLKGCVCEVCGRSFSHMSNLIRHSYVHTGFKPYPCKVCGKRFTQVTSLNQHNISYHSNKLNPCPAVPEICDKMFRTPLIAKQHAYRVHPDVQWEHFIPENLGGKRQRKYYCRHCGETFQSTNDLKFHFIQHYKNVENISRVTCIKENLYRSSETGPKNHTDNVQEIKLLDSFAKECDPSTNEILEEYCVIVSDDLESEQEEVPCDLIEVSTELRNESIFSSTGNADPSSLYDSDLLKGVGTEVINPTGFKISKSSNDNSSFEPQLDTQNALNWTARRIDDLSHFDLASNAIVVKSNEKAINRHLECTESMVGNRASSEHSQENLESKLAERKECRKSPEILLEQCANEESSSGMSHDVDMGLCPDSPNNTLNNQPIFDNDVRDQFGDVKCLESYQIPEPLILSFGDSYSALLKEIGIGEDETNLEVSSDANGNTSKQENCHDGPMLWDNYSTLFKESQQDGQGEEDKGTQLCNRDHVTEPTVAIESPSMGNISTAIVEQEFSPTQQQENYVLTMEFSENKDTVIFVAQNSSIPNEDVPEINLTEPQEIKGKSSNMMCSDDCYEKGPSSPEKVTKCSKNKKCKTIKNHTQKNVSLQPQCPKVPTKMSSSPTSEFSEVPCASESRTNRTGKKCPECGKIFFKTSNLTQHLGLHFPNMKTYECSICNMSFSWKSSLNKHMTSHSENTIQFLCDMCGKQYKSFNQVQQHKKRDHESLRPNICSTCNKSFFRKHDLLTHQRIHTNNKPFMCETCGKVFNHISHVKRHENVHLKNGIKTVASVTSQNL